MPISKHTTTQKEVVALGSQRSYNEVIEFLDTHWSKNHTDTKLTTITSLDKALNNPSKGTPTILIGGTNGKGLTIHFATKLLLEEKMGVGAFYSPHTLSYNERIVFNNEIISNKAFTELANEVINTAQAHEISATSFEILLMVALMYFKNNNADVAFLEMFENSPADPTNVCHPAVYALTRVTDETLSPQKEETVSLINTMVAAVKPGTYVISGDQSKLNLQIICDAIQKKGAVWSMPIRKLAPLPYPFEQLHGRCAALAERICQIFFEHFITVGESIVALENSLLAKQTGQRGRPTLQAKRESELNPKKTLTQFWQEQEPTLPGRFQLLKEKPSILLDNATNIDALSNLLLGIRLLHYQKPHKGLAFIFGCDKSMMNVEEFLRLLRYFTKKNSAQIILCPIKGIVPGTFEVSWDAEHIGNDEKARKIKIQVAKNFEDAFEKAKKFVDDRNGLVVISGSQSIIGEYWHYKGIKKI